jgi:hypothetical protein
VYTLVYGDVGRQRRVKFDKYSARKYIKLFVKRCQLHQAGR